MLVIALSTPRFRFPRPGFPPRGAVSPGIGCLRRPGPLSAVHAEKPRHRRLRVLSCPVRGDRAGEVPGLPRRDRRRASRQDAVSTGTRPKAAGPATPSTRARTRTSFPSTPGISTTRRRVSSSRAATPGSRSAGPAITGRPPFRRTLGRVLSSPRTPAAPPATFRPIPAARKNAWPVIPWKAGGPAWARSRDDETMAMNKARDLLIGTAILACLRAPGRGPGRARAPRRPSYSYRATLYFDWFGIAFAQDGGGLNQVGTRLKFELAKAPSRSWTAPHRRPRPPEPDRGELEPGPSLQRRA